MNRIIRKPFSELTLTELFEIVRARFDVFVAEQHILEPEFDDIDLKSIHIFIPEAGSSSGKKSRTASEIRRTVSR